MPTAAWPEILRTAAAHTDVVARGAGSTAADQRGRPIRRADRRLVARSNREFDLPIRLFEIGSSAGLNLRADHYRYRYDGGQWGPADSPVTIDDAWRGRAAARGAVRIVERNGYDIAPIDVTSADGEMTVLSYVWPDQTARLDRLRGAIAVARDVPARLDRQTAADAVAGLTLADGALTVLWHSITWQYLSADERAAVRDGVDALAEHGRCRRAVRPPHHGAGARGARRAAQVPGAGGELARRRDTRSWANAIRTARR